MYCVETKFTLATNPCDFQELFKLPSDLINNLDTKKLKLSSKFNHANFMNKFSEFTKFKVFADDDYKPFKKLPAIEEFYTILADFLFNFMMYCIKNNKVEEHFNFINDINMTPLDRMAKTNKINDATYLRACNHFKLTYNLIKYLYSALTPLINDTVDNYLIEAKIVSKEAIKITSGLIKVFN